MNFLKIFSKKSNIQKTKFFIASVDPLRLFRSTSNFYSRRKISFLGKFTKFGEDSARITGVTGESVKGPIRPPPPSRKGLKDQGEHLVRIRL